MRRAPIVLIATVLGTAGVLLFKPLPTSSLTPTDASGASTPSGTSTSSGDSPAGGTSSTSAPAASASSSAAGAKDGTFSGDAETTRFGTTQVSVTVAGGRISEVSVLQLNQADSRSLQISQDAVPTLRSEVLAQQTAAVDTVSGATWTSAAYEASLQSALDAAGFTAADGSTASQDLSTLQDSGGGPGH